jgi:hypothetical protein
MPRFFVVRGAWGWVVGCLLGGGLLWGATRLLAPASRLAPRVPGAVSSPLGSEEHITAVGDFNGDGHLDLALTNGDSSEGEPVSIDPQGAVTIWLGDGRGGLCHGPVLRSTEATLLASLDVDGDGDTDLLAGSCCRDSLLLWRNQGQGRLMPEGIAAPYGRHDMTTGDVDGDGDVDIVVPFGSQVETGLNDGQGHFTRRVQELRPGAPDDQAPFNQSFEQVALADIDGDHDLDLLVPQPERLSLFLNDGRGRFGHEQRVAHAAAYGQHLAIGDLNGDARPDILLATGERLHCYLNDGAGRFGRASFTCDLTSPGVQPRWLALGDIDRDGDVDLVLNEGWQEVWVRLNNGQAQFDPPYRVPARYSELEELALADLDRDGQLDVLSPILTLPRAVPQRAELTTLRFPAGQPAYVNLAHPPTRPGGQPVLPLVEAALQRRVARWPLPPGSVLGPAATHYEFVLTVSPQGIVEQVTTLPLGGPEVPGDLLASLQDTLCYLPGLVPGRLRGQPVRTALYLRPLLLAQGPPRPVSIPTYRPAPAPTPEPDPAADQPTLRRGLARRRAGEPAAAFVQRVLPHAYASAQEREGHKSFVRYAWRPTSFGPQLFLAVRGQEATNEGGTDLLVFDPIRPRTYTVQTLQLETMGDLTDLEALFFADIDHDGRQELLALVECSLREVLSVDKHGNRHTGHVAHYQTYIFRYGGLGRTGRPRYRADTLSRPYLDDLPTAAAVRQALARQASRRPLVRRAPATRQ